MNELNNEDDTLAIQIKGMGGSVMFFVVVWRDNLAVTTERPIRHRVEKQLTIGSVTELLRSLHNAR